MTTISDLHSRLVLAETELTHARAEVEQLRADQRYLDESVRNQAIRETIHKEELKRLRALIDKHNDECRECPVINAAG